MSFPHAAGVGGPSKTPSAVAGGQDFPKEVSGQSAVEFQRFIGHAWLALNRLGGSICSGSVSRIGRLGFGKKEVFRLVGLPDTVKHTVSTRPQAGSVAPFPACRLERTASPLRAPGPESGPNKIGGPNHPDVDRCLRCRCLKVSHSGFHDWARRMPSLRAQDNARLLEKIRQRHVESDGVMGAPRMHEELGYAGETASLNRVARLMSGAGLYGIPQKRLWRRKPSGVRPTFVRNHLGARLRRAGAEHEVGGDPGRSPRRRVRLHRAIPQSTSAATIGCSDRSL